MSDYLYTDDFLRDFAKGKEAAFKALHAEYFPRLTATAHKIIRNYSEAEDIAIEALSRLMIAHRQYEYGSATLDRLKNHLYLSVRNRCFDYLESFRRTTSAGGRDVTDALGALFEESVEDHMVYAEVIAGLNEILKGLSEQRRTALELVYFQNKKVKDAAAEMAVPLSTFKYIRERAFQEISNKFPGKNVLTSLIILLAFAASSLTSCVVALFGHY